MAEFSPNSILSHPASCRRSLQASWARFISRRIRPNSVDQSHSKYFQLPLCATKKDLAFERLDKADAARDALLHASLSIQDSTASAPIRALPISFGARVYRRGLIRRESIERLDDMRVKKLAGRVTARSNTIEWKGDSLSISYE